MVTVRRKPKSSWRWRCAAARAPAAEAGFACIAARVFESQHGLRHAGAELRHGEPAAHATGRQGATVTYKGTPTPASTKAGKSWNQGREGVGDRAIFERLGYHPVFRYEKYRTEFQQPRRAGVATLDETPVGVFLELEGTPPWIDRTARLLGSTSAITSRRATRACTSIGVSPTGAGRRTCHFHLGRSSFTRTATGRQLAFANPGGTSEIQRRPVCPRASDQGLPARS